MLKNGEYSFIDECNIEVIPIKQWPAASEIIVLEDEDGDLVIFDREAFDEHCTHQYWDVKPIDGYIYSIDQLVEKYATKSGFDRDQSAYDEIFGNQAEKGHSLVDGVVKIHKATGKYKCADNIFASIVSVA